MIAYILHISAISIFAMLLVTFTLRVLSFIKLSVVNQMWLQTIAFVVMLGASTKVVPTFTEDMAYWTSLATIGLAFLHIALNNYVADLMGKAEVKSYLKATNLLGLYSDNYTLQAVYDQGVAAYNGIQAEMFNRLNSYVVKAVTFGLMK